MKGITEIDERAALLLVRAYKAAYQSEGPRIRSEVWQNIAHQLNKQNTRNLTVTQWKKRISNIKSLVKLKSDMERRGRKLVNWTTIEREYLRLFPNTFFEDDNSSLSGGNPNSATNNFGLEEDQSLGELEEMDDSPATMVKTETPAKWTAEQLRQTFLEAHKQLLLSASAATTSNSSSNRAESNASTVNSTPTTTTDQSAASSTTESLGHLPPTTSTGVSNELNFQSQRLFMPSLVQSQAPPVLDLRSVVTQMSPTQRKQAILSCLRNFRQQIDFFTELLQQDIELSDQSF